MNNIEHVDITKGLVSEIKQLIETSKSKVAVTVNSEISLLYWTIGKRIKEELENNEGTVYGKSIVQSISNNLVMEYGSSLSEKNLRRMLQFAEVFPEEKIVVSLIRQLSWTQDRTLLSVVDEHKSGYNIMGNRNNVEFSSIWKHGYNLDFNYGNFATINNFKHQYGKE